MRGSPCTSKAAGGRDAAGHETARVRSTKWHGVLRKGTLSPSRTREVEWCAPGEGEEVTSVPGETTGSRHTANEPTGGSNVHDETARNHDEAAREMAQMRRSKSDESEQRAKIWPSRRREVVHRDESVDAEVASADAMRREGENDSSSSPNGDRAEAEDPPNAKTCGPTQSRTTPAASQSAEDSSSSPPLHTAASSTASLRTTASRSRTAQPSKLRMRPRRKSCVLSQR